MTRLLDARTSQNASYFASVSDTFAFDPVSFAQVGLNCVAPVGIIRVQFTATATITIPAGSGNIVVLMDIVRGTLPTDTLVYSAVLTELSNDFDVNRFFTATGSDYNVSAPPSELLVYTAFLRCPDAVTLTRVGPESFNAAAYCDG